MDPKCILFSGPNSGAEKWPISQQPVATCGLFSGKQHGTNKYSQILRNTSRYKQTKEPTKQTNKPQQTTKQRNKQTSAMWGVLGSSWSILGALWSVLGSFWSFLTRPGGIREHFQSVLERSRLVLERSGASWGCSASFWAQTKVSRAQHTNGARNIEIVRARAMSHPWGRARVSLRALSRVPPLGKIVFSRASETAHCEKRDFLSRRFLFRNDPKTPYRPKQFQETKKM